MEMLEYSILYSRTTAETHSRDWEVNWDLPDDKLEAFVARTTA